MTVKVNGLNFLLLPPALHPRQLLFNLPGFWTLFQALIGLEKALLAAPHVNNLKKVPELRAEIITVAQHPTH